MIEVFRLKNIYVASAFLAFFIAYDAAAAPVACCYAGGSCAEANGVQQCRNTGGTPANSDSCSPNPCTAGRNENGVSRAAVKETVKAEDFGLSTPTLLPTSPFYFIKNISRGFQRFFTFNPIKKVELELKFADEKILETKQVAEDTPDKTEALGRAIENYRSSQEELKKRLEVLKETSENPNVDSLLEKITDRAVKHEKLFLELKTKVEGKEELKQKLETSKVALEDAVAKAAIKDKEERFAEKLDIALEKNKDGGLSDPKSQEIVGGIIRRVEQVFTESASEPSGACKDYEDKILSIKASYERKEIAEKDFLSETEVLQKSFVLCLQEGERPKRSEAKVFYPCDKFGQEARDLADRYRKGKMSDDEYAEKSKKLIKESKECFDLFGTSKIPSSYPPACDELWRQLARAFDDWKGDRTSDREYNKIKGELLQKIKDCNKGLYTPPTLKVPAVKEPSYWPEGYTPSCQEIRQALRDWYHGYIQGYIGRIQYERAKEELEKQLRECFGKVWGPASQSGPPGSGALPPWLGGPQPYDNDKIQKTISPKAASSRCDEINSALRELKQNFADGKITESEFERSREVYQKEHEAVCPQPQSLPKKFMGGGGPVEPTPCWSLREQLQQLEKWYAEGTADIETYKAKKATVDEALKTCVDSPRSTVVEPAFTPPPPPKPPADEPPQDDGDEDDKPIPAAYKLEADDFGFYLGGSQIKSIVVGRGADVVISFYVHEKNVYYGGLDFRSVKFKTETVKPGGQTAVTFLADASFTITSYWPLSGTAKADLRVEVQ